ncbi:unnamed protein product [Orchesella dallaii]|uniref:E3 SUMO-protein ligase NSE2 n=1 Tax=Orchesella dallaii TaxID=48710 RepID=A0ABP1PK00_9HEXA
MSARRGRGKGASAAAAAAAQILNAKNSLEASDIDADPVISSIRFGMDSIMKIVNDTVPRCPVDDEEFKQTVIERMESSLLQLVEAELAYAQTNTIVNQVVEELNLEGNHEMETKEFLDSVNSISEISNGRILEYKSTLTEDVLRAHPTFLRMRTHLEALLDAPIDEPTTETYNAETETEEVDLDESFSGHEVIPELDPISKKPLEDPVRNRHCRHIYGKTAMLELIKKNQRFRCPQMGCSNNKFLRAADLIDDPQLTARVNGEAVATASGSSSGASSTEISPPRSSIKAKRGRGGRRRR